MRSKIVAALPKLSWGSFVATLILMPFRLHIVLLARPVATIWRDYTDFLLYASDVALLLTVLPWMLQLGLQGAKPDLAPRFITVPLAGLTLIAGLTSITSIDPGLSTYHFVRLMLLFLFYLYVINNVKTLQQLIAPLTAQVIIQSLVAIAQGLTQKSIGLYALGEYELDSTWNGVSTVFTEQARALRAYGLTDHPNLLGGYLAFGFVLLFVAWIFGKPQKTFLFITIPIGTIALFYTYSRSAWLSLLAGAALVLFFTYAKQESNKFRKGAVGILILTLLVLPFLWANLEFVGARLGADNSFQEIPSEIGSIGERRVLVSAANEIFQMHPITGVGVGALPQAFLTEFPNFPVKYQPAHFVLLDAAVETGLLGAVFYLGLLVLPWIALYLRRQMKFTPDLIAASGLLLATTVVGFFDYYTWLLVPGRLWQWLAWGLWARFYVGAIQKSKA